MKKIAIIGSGTAGVLSAAHFSRWADNCEIELHYDPNIKPQSVGEGATVILPISLVENMNFDHNDLHNIDGTIKCGVRKINWSNEGGDFAHSFAPPFTSYHFNAVKLQSYLLSELSQKIKIVEQNVFSSDVDADYVMDCSGTPKSFEDFNICEGISVNAVHVNQCYWDNPTNMVGPFTLAVARPYGWVFGIPLRNRCSIGYLYNDKINTLDEIKEDIQNVFDQFNLTPSDTTNTFSFNNYYRKNNFTDRIAYNGNCSFFLEPMEATSIQTMSYVQRLAYDIWFQNMKPGVINEKYLNLIEQTETMIMLHYFAGSIFKTDFWDYSKQRANDIMQKAVKDQKFARIINAVKNQNPQQLDYAGWGYYAFNQNLAPLGILDKLVGLCND